MKVGFVTRNNHDSYWGGDLKTIFAIAAGMDELGVKTEIAPSSAEISADVDFAFLTNACLDLRAEKTMLDLRHIPYGVIPFYEDPLSYYPSSWGFFTYISLALSGYVDQGLPLTIERLKKTPHVYRYFAKYPSRWRDYFNEELLESAHLVVANSAPEARSLLAHVPKARVEAIHWAPGFAEEFRQNTPTEEFLAFTGLTSQSYILQVGRIQPRKNQLATLLASEDIDMPLVFISTTTSAVDYTATLVHAIQQRRKGETIIVSQHIPSCQFGEKHRIIQMPRGEKLSTSMLQSAFYHAGIHLHPAFAELPGATYFESAYYGVPTIASSMTTIGDYFASPPLEDERMVYVDPTNLEEITRAIQKCQGKRYPLSTHPIFARTRKDVAREILSHL